MPFGTKVDMPFDTKVDMPFGTKVDMPLDTKVDMPFHTKVDMPFHTKVDIKQRDCCGADKYVDPANIYELCDWQRTWKGWQKQEVKFKMTGLY